MPTISNLIAATENVCVAHFKGQLLGLWGFQVCIFTNEKVTFLDIIFTIKLHLSSHENTSTSLLITQSPLHITLAQQADVPQMFSFKTSGFESALLSIFKCNHLCPKSAAPRFDWSTKLCQNSNRTGK